MSFPPLLWTLQAWWRSGLMFLRMNLCVYFLKWRKKKKEMSLYTMIIIHDHVFFNDAKSIMVNLFCFLLFELFKMATMFFNYQDQLIILRMGATVSMWQWRSRQITNNWWTTELFSTIQDYFKQWYQKPDIPNLYCMKINIPFAPLFSYR